MKLKHLPLSHFRSGGGEKGGAEEGRVTAPIHSRKDHMRQGWVELM